MIVQFVSFETTVAPNEFRAQWDEHNKEVNGQDHVILQQEVDGKNLQRYISQHRFQEDDIKFVFKKRRRSSQTPELDIRIKEAGGYSALQIESLNESEPNHSKIFVFLTTFPELKLYQELSYQYLNIYQAYYESSTYTYILEFFIENTQIDQLIEQLKIHNRVTEIGIYKECKQTKKISGAKTPNVKKLIM